MSLLFFLCKIITTVIKNLPYSEPTVKLADLVFHERLWCKGRDTCSERTDNELLLRSPT